MALTEQTILKQVTILPVTKSIQVQWGNQVLRDDVVISETYERKAYSEDQKDDFLAEVEGAESYVTAVGWV